MERSIFLLRLAELHQLQLSKVGSLQIDVEKIRSEGGIIFEKKWKYIYIQGNTGLRFRLILLMSLIIY